MANKQLLQAAGDGTAVPAGYIGEKITWTTSPTTQIFNTSESDWTNATINLSSGVWLVTANISFEIQSGAITGNYSYIRVKITDSSNVVVESQSRQLLANTAASANNTNSSCLPFSFVANILTPTSYKIRAVRVDGVGTGGGAYLINSAAPSSEFFAVRIA